MMEVRTSRLQITAHRGGSIAEISEFLSDVETAYLAVYAFERLSPARRSLHSLPPRLWLELGYPFQLSSPASHAAFTIDAVPPNARLTLERVRIESPGYWEFLGALNPLEQIRQYLNDRHKRRQDREYRELLERQRMELENEQIQQQIEQGSLSIAREYVEFLREMGYDAEEIRELVWQRLGPPLTRLGRHQDSGLIGGAGV